MNSNTVPTTSDFVKMCKALGDLERVQIAELLLCEGPMHVSLLAERIGISQPVCSNKLKWLEEAKLVAKARVGQYVVFCISAEQLLLLSKKVEELVSRVPKAQLSTCPVNPSTMNFIVEPKL